MKIYRLLHDSAWIFTVFSSKKIIRSKVINLKNKSIVKLKFKTFYAQFRNNPVGRRNIFLSESDEVTKSDVCFQEIRQRWSYNSSLATAAHISNKSERETRVKETATTSALPNVTRIIVDIFETDVKFTIVYSTNYKTVWK